MARMQNWSHDGEHHRPASPPPASHAHDDPWASPPLTVVPRRDAPPEVYDRLAWQSAPPRPGAGVGVRVGIAAVSIVMAAVIIVGGLYMSKIPSNAAGSQGSATPVTQPSGSAQPSTPPSSVSSSSPVASSVPSASASRVPVAAEPTSGGWPLPERTWEALPAADSTSVLYDVQVSPLNDVPPATLSDCPAPRRVTSEQQWKADVRAQWSCVHAAWVPVFKQLGWSTVEPEVKFYLGEGSKSECGYLTAPAFYCSAGAGTVFFGAGHLEMATDWDLSVNEMVNHEYSHHLQKLAGIMDAKLNLASDNELERRSELQATCLSAAMTYRNPSVAFDADDLASWNQRLDTMLIDAVHGSRESLVYWGTRGLYAAVSGDCNTWVAPSTMVS